MLNQFYNKTLWLKDLTPFCTFYFQLLNLNTFKENSPTKPLTFDLEMCGKHFLIFLSIQKSDLKKKKSLNKLFRLQKRFLKTQI